MTQTPERRREWSREWRARNREHVLTQQRENRKKYGRPCLDCGALTDGSNGYAKAPERCAKCTPRARTFWTRETIIEAILLFEHRYGEPPTATQWNTALARRAGRDDWAETFSRDGDYPQSNTVQDEFGSWNAGIAAAGFEPRGVGKRGPNRPRA